LSGWQRASPTRQEIKSMAKFPDFGFADSDPRTHPTDLRPPAPSEAAQQNSEPDSSTE
jgi:hypothetical protein